jgi:uncharacterized membrane protein YccF (DUF307 family)
MPFKAVSVSGDFLAFRRVMKSVQTVSETSIGRLQAALRGVFFSFNGSWFLVIGSWLALPSHCVRNAFASISVCVRIAFAYAFALRSLFPQRDSADAFALLDFAK